jgi:hypothetical protein
MGVRKTWNGTLQLGARGKRKGEACTAEPCLCARCHVLKKRTHFITLSSEGLQKVLEGLSKAFKSPLKRPMEGP